jgi:hypothetical protein
MDLPKPCGPVSRRVVETLRAEGDSTSPLMLPASVITDRDVQLALWTIYELSYRGFNDVDPGHEWALGLVGLRLDIERRFEEELRHATWEDVRKASDPSRDSGDLILDLVESSSGSRLSSYLRRDATTEQMCDFLRERSVQQLKESDPQSFLLPRLSGAAKVALAELQYDEYGAGRPERLHQTMYGDTLVAVGLDPDYGAYVNEITAVSLASANVMSMFGLNRRLLAAGVGHFAAFEASSSVPSRRIAAGLERLDLSPAAEYFTEHVEADAVHEQIAARDICGSVLRDDPTLLGEVVFGVVCALYLDDLSGREFLARWGVDETAVGS